MRYLAATIAATIVALGGAMNAAHAQTDQHRITIDTPPRITPGGKLPDGAILGNGDVGIAFGGNAAAQNFYISKGDFWTEEKQILLGGIRFVIPQWNAIESGVENWRKQVFRYNPSFRQELDIGTATLTGSYATDDIRLRSESYLSATENVFVTTWENQSRRRVSIACQVWTKTAETTSGSAPVGPGRDRIRESVHGRSYGIFGKTGLTPVAAGADDGVLWVKRGAGSEDSGRYTEAIIAARILQKDPITQILNPPVSSGTTFVLDPGEAVKVIVKIESLGSAHRSKDTRSDYADVFDTLGKTDREDLLNLRQDHLDWWQAYWQRSSVTLEEKVLERYWYESLYVMGSCSRKGKAAPGLWFWVTTDNPAWKGDYHLDYNFEAPYYGMYSANRTDLILPYYQAMLDQIENGRRFAKRGLYTGRPSDGIILPPGIGPDGRIADMNDVGQLTHATEAALPFLKYYYYTGDKDFLQNAAYPYLAECAKFWKGYLRKEGGRYVVHSSCGDEKHYYDSFNAAKAIAFIRALFKGLLVVGEALDLDAKAVAAWEDIYDHISAYPTLIHRDKEVIPYAESSFELYEKGRPYGLVGVSPADDITLSSDPNLLKRAQNTLAETDAWHYVCETFPIAARLGYRPDALINRFIEEFSKLRQPNGTYAYGAGGIETCGSIETINSMLLQSHEGFLRLFPVWPRDKYAKFEKLRTYGAFLVSSEMKRGMIGKIDILSEKGNECRILNPWGDESVTVRSGQQEVESQVAGGMIVFPTTTGGEYMVAPRRGARIQDPEYFRNFGGRIEAAEAPAEPDLGPAEGVRLEAETFSWGKSWWQRHENRREGYISCLNRDDFIVFENVDFGNGDLHMLVCRLGVHDSRAGQDVLFIVDGDRKTEAQSRYELTNVVLAPDLLHGRLIGTLKTEATGGYQKYRIQEVKIEPVSGIHDLYIYFTGNGTGNFDWFEFRMSGGTIQSRH